MSNDKRRSLITYNHITYFLYVISYFTAGLLWIVPIVMNYAKRHDANGSWLATHFDWQIKTFWYSIVWFVIGIILITFALGGFGVSVLADSGNIAIGSILLAGLGLLIIQYRRRLIVPLCYVFSLESGSLSLFSRDSSALVTA